MVVPELFSSSTTLDYMLGHFVKTGTTFILSSDLVPSTYHRAIEMYKVCHENMFNPSRCIKASFYISESRLNSPTTRGF